MKAETVSQNHLAAVDCISGQAPFNADPAIDGVNGDGRSLATAGIMAACEQYALNGRAQVLTPISPSEVQQIVAQVLAGGKE